MKKLSIAILLLIATTTASAQGPIAKGQSQFNAGVGLSSWGIPIYIGFDHGIHKDVTLGMEVSFRNHHNKYNNYKYNHNIFGISGNVNYHFNSLLSIPNNWDFYAGLNVGFYHWNSSKDYPGGYSSGIGIAGQIGGRYYFTNKMGVNLEFGGGNAFSGGKLGISIRL